MAEELRGLEGVGAVAMPPPPQGLSRRRFVVGSAGLDGATALSGCASPAPSTGPDAGARAPVSDPTLVRLVSVTTVRDGGLYDVLLPEFEARSGYHVALTIAEDVYGPARAGQADVVLSHYGHKDVDAFVQCGFGRWPHTVLFNSIALIGPVSDPARVAGLGDLVTVFQRIAGAGAPFVVNNLEGLDYLAQTVALTAGLAATGGMLVNEGLQMGPAMDQAAARGGYTMWGLTPFLRYVQDKPLPLRAMVMPDPMLQRIMVTIVVNPDKVSGVNTIGAAALQDYLLTPATQAKIRAFRLPGMDQPVFWPAGRNNQSSYLPALTGATPTPHPGGGADPGGGTGAGTGGGGGGGTGGAGGSGGGGR